MRLAGDDVGQVADAHLGNVFICEHAFRSCSRRSFFERGGAMIDSSPMYGYSETIIGEMLKQTSHPRLFSATKIWTVGKALGRWQLERSRKLWGVPKFDLVHIHNMLDWRTHVETLKEMKAAGAVRYIGITTSEGVKHAEMEQALKREAEREEKHRDEKRD